ncbi:hypothetical protein ABT063_43350 [Streptomyces sp. NPDC002838]|uniref:hypothetical protein n=1 Tax=Streptomyces sp. NPDC002838 TaxID=3154436 RepID=UPI0033227577
MDTPWPPRRTVRRSAPRAAAPREPVDHARIGRGWVRGLAGGMNHDQALAALENARFDARQGSRHEDRPGRAERRAAELAEWDRLVQLLADGGTYDRDTDTVVHQDPAVEAAAAEAREAEQFQRQQLADRADTIERLAQADQLAGIVPRDGDEAVRMELLRRDSLRIEAVDAWLAHALAADLGHYRDPAAREAAAGLLPPPLLAHAALLAALARLAPSSDTGQLAFAARLTAADPEAAADLADFLTRAINPSGSPA